MLANRRRSRPPDLRDESVPFFVGPTPRLAVNSRNELMGLLPGFKALVGRGHAAKHRAIHTPGLTAFPQARAIFAPPRPRAFAPFLQFQLNPRSCSSPTFPPLSTQTTRVPGGAVTSRWSSAATGAAAAPS